MYKNCVILAAHIASQPCARMPQLFGRFIGKTCMNGGVVKPHLIDNKNSYEYPRAGNEQTTGRQRVGIPLKPLCQNPGACAPKLCIRAAKAVDGKKIRRPNGPCGFDSPARTKFTSR